MEPTTSNNVSLESKPAEPVVKKSHKSHKIIITAIILLVVIAAVVAGFAAGYLYAGVKSPEQKVTVQSAVCDDLVNEYIKASTGTTFNMAVEMNNLSQKVPNNDAAKNDPNCLFIKLYAAYFFNNNYSGALAYAKEIKTLLDDGKSLDVRLPVFGSIDGMIDVIQKQVDVRNEVQPGGSSG